MEGVLVDDQIGPKLLDLGEQDVFRLGVERRAQPDLSGQRPQQRLERRDGALQPCRECRGAAAPGGCGDFDRHAMLARPGRLQPRIVDVDLGGGMARRAEIPRIEIGDAEQAGISRRHLRGIGGVLKPGLAVIEPSQKARIVRVEDEDAHDRLDRDPEAVILVDPGLVGAAGHLAPPVFMVEIPLHGPAEAVVEIDAAPVAEFAGEFAGVDGVAVVVAGPVGDEADQRAAGISGSRRT